MQTWSVFAETCSHIKAHNSELRGQEEAGRTQRISELFTCSTTLKFAKNLNNCAVFCHTCSTLDIYGIYSIVIFALILPRTSQQLRHALLGYILQCIHETTFRNSFRNDKIIWHLGSPQSVIIIVSFLQVVYPLKNHIPLHVLPISIHRKLLSI